MQSESKKNCDIEIELDKKLSVSRLALAMAAAEKSRASTRRSDDDSRSNTSDCTSIQSNSQQSIFSIVQEMVDRRASQMRYEVKQVLVHEFRKSIRKDLIFKESFLKSKRTSLRFSMIGLYTRHVANITSFLYSFTTIFYQYPYILQSDTLNSSLCTIRLQAVIIGSSIWYIIFQIFYNVRAWGLLNDPNLTQSIHMTGTVVRYQRMILVSTFIAVVTACLLPISVMTTNPHVRIIYQERVCVPEYDTYSNSMFFVANSTVLVLTFIAMILTGVTYQFQPKLLPNFIFQICQQIKIILLRT